MRDDHLHAAARGHYALLTSPTKNFITLKLQYSNRQLTFIAWLSASLDLGEAAGLGYEMVDELRRERLSVLISCSVSIVWRRLSL